MWENSPMWDDNSSLSGNIVTLDSTTKIITLNNLNNYISSESIDDDDYIDIQSATSGFGFILVGDNEEYATFTFATDGTVVLLTDSTANVVNTDTDTKFCIFDNGTNIRIRNRLGSAKTLKINIYYS